MVAATTKLAIPDSSVMDLWRVLSALLVIGNVTFLQVRCPNISPLSFPLISAPLASSSFCLQNDDDKADIADGAALDAAETLVGAGRLASLLTTRTMTRGGGGKRMSTYTIDYNKEKAEGARDAVIKAVYTKVFDWIVDKVNGFISGGDEATKLPYAPNPLSQPSDSASYVGLLEMRLRISDRFLPYYLMAGTSGCLTFSASRTSSTTPSSRCASTLRTRSFSNSFSRASSASHFFAMRFSLLFLGVKGMVVSPHLSFAICITASVFFLRLFTETLLSPDPPMPRGRCVFKEEETLHVKEGVPWKDIEFQDNQGCITMLEKPPNGVLRLLDSQCKAPTPTEQNFCKELNKVHAKADFIQPTRKQRMTDEEGFIVRHYAGDVVYHTAAIIGKSTGMNEVPWTDKNNDTLQAEWVARLSNSEVGLLQEPSKPPLPRSSQPRDIAPLP